MSLAFKVAKSATFMQRKFSLLAIVPCSYNVMCYILKMNRYGSNLHFFLLSPKQNQILWCGFKEVLDNMKLLEDSKALYIFCLCKLYFWPRAMLIGPKRILLLLLFFLAWNQGQEQKLPKIDTKGTKNVCECKLL